jgi:hypothetical protein
MDSPEWQAKADPEFWQNFKAGVLDRTTALPNFFCRGGVPSNQGKTVTTVKG